jgi:hypothetical protein
MVDFNEARLPFIFEIILIVAKVLIAGFDVKASDPVEKILGRIIDHIPKIL